MKSQLNNFAKNASKVDWVVKALSDIEYALNQYQWDEISKCSYYYTSKSKVNGIEVCLCISILHSNGSTLERNSSVNRRIGYSIELTCSNSSNKLFKKVYKEFEDILKDYQKNKYLNSIDEVEAFTNRIEELANFLSSNFIEV